MQPAVTRRGGEIGPLGAPSTLRQAVVDTLRKRIVSGEIAPGTLLRETALAKSLQVSATPVREALGTLASEGLVEIEAHRLKRVTPIDFAATLDLIKVQAELWRLGYAWGMPRIGPAQVVLLEQAIAVYRAAIAQGDYVAAMSAGLDFHTVFITASANGELLRSTLDRRGLIARFILLHGLATLSTSGLGQHEGILLSFHAGDHAGVLSRLDQMSARLMVLAAEGCAQDPNIIDLFKTERD
jgi:DNA-binding GntR family transcriptional regulator